MEIRSAAYVISSPSFEQCPAPDRPEYAFIGRSNVGKSSLINALARNDKLAKTSGSPGKTQLINHFAIDSVSPGKKSDLWYLVDLPGYGFAKVSVAQRKAWEKMIEDYLTRRPNLAFVFLLIDSRHTPQKSDLAFAENLRARGVPFNLVFTKSDKENQRTVQKNVNDFLAKLRETWQFLPRHFVTSAVKRTGRDAILRFIEENNEDK